VEGGGVIARRRFVILLGGAALLRPRLARADGTVKRLGVLMPTAEGDAETEELGGVFRRALEAQGWAGGRNLRFDYRWGDGDERRIDLLARQLVATSPDAIFAGGDPALAPLKHATRTIPIVFVSATDPLAQGFVKDLDHPGGNITGFANFSPAMAGRWLSLLKEIAPGLARVGVLYNPETAPYSDAYLQAIAARAPALAIKAAPAPIHDEDEIDRAVAALQGGGAGLVVPSDAFTLTHAQAVIAAAAKHRVPAVYAFDVFATNGGLVSYGIDLADEMRQAAHYVDRVLSGDNPGDLPVQMPSKFKLVINMRTAAALGLQVPDALQAEADVVIR
jgi:putative tryptophan/tyrosine transport system substrate-binding protein